jgi:hypothetical protein
MQSERSHQFNKSESGAERREPLEIIPYSDYISIKLTGGAYRGHVTSNAETEFHDLLVDRRAFWNTRLRKTVLVSLETYATREDGKPLRGPEQAEAYKIAFTRESVTSEPLDEISFLLTQQTRDVAQDQLRQTAIGFHRILREYMDKDQSQLDSARVREVVATQSNPVGLRLDEA